MLHCRPLRISMAAPLQRPLAETSPGAFFSLWSTLPMKMQVSGEWAAWWHAAAVVVWAGWGRRTCACAWRARCAGPVVMLRVLQT
jgi:hypothetical protein